ncbi:ABC transporter permease [Tepidimicrobium xylanilyticum]|uniref:Iron(III) transport system permease protein n=1 Tax=Tepidimicrobium xylanilyticum TaxID=1123352 RepID=A0A1H3B7J0_9FIRM|nr:iron ABC transporter permease [Tepidimicrobium xylanilyticum]SDX37374.1 iron(III) transport system permease protein [Tepidimicrobium xylanilyticum]
MCKSKIVAYKIIDYFIFTLLLILLFIFILRPIYSIIRTSFILDGQFTLDVYRNLFSNNIRLIKNSLFVATLTTIISVVISVNVAIYASLSKGKVRKILILLLMLTMISPPFLSSLAYIKLFGRRGFITHELLGLALNTYGWQGIVSMQSLSTSSMNAFILIGIINRIDKDIIKSSLDLGASTSYTIRSIILPMMKPGILNVALLTFVRSLSDFGTPMTIGGAFNVLATQAYLNVIAYSKMELAAAICVLILIPAVIAFTQYRIFTRKNILYVQNTVTNDMFNKDADESIEVSGFLWKFIQIFTSLYLFTMIIQYLTIFLTAITKYSHGEMYFTLEHFIHLRKYLSDSFIRSIAYGFITGIGGGVLSFFISYYVEIRKFRASRLIDFVVTLPSIVPGVFMGIAYILAFNNKPLELTGTSAIVILNIMFRQLPSNTRIYNANLSQLGPELADAGKDLGAPSIYIVKDIIFPMSKTAFMTNFVNNFKNTMTTVGAIIFLIYPGKKLAILEMFSAIREGKYGVGAAASVMIIFITLTINLLMSRLIMRWKNVC